MLSVIQTSSIVFYAVSAGLALLAAVLFFCMLLRKKRRRHGGDVLCIVLSALCMAAALAVGAFAVVGYYAPLKTAVADAGGKLAFLYDGKQLFAVPALGKAVGLFERLGLSGVIVPFALFILFLLTAIAVGVKTRPARRKKEKAQQETSVPVEDASIEEQTYIQDAPSAVALDTGAEGELPPPEEKPLETDAAMRIVEEIGALVDGGAAREDDEIAAQLKRAISEGYALVNETPENAAEAEQAAEQQTDEIPREELAEQPIEDESEQEILPERDEQTVAKMSSAEEEQDVLFETQQPVESIEEQEDNDATEEEYLDAPIEHNVEIVPERTTLSDKKVIAVAPESVQEEKRPPVFEYGDVYMRTRVRTIIRRPPAKRAEEREEAPASVKASASVKTAASRTAGVAKSQTPIKPPVAPHKEVVAEKNSLPLTRKYIIINRRNAATVFNDYLNSKREREKEELAGSLNTIIMK
ncbi:MAG: hypothetical protein HFE46_08410 [Clostridia bacterium]|nr:hypothetical protein [Clostridia bacterium]